MNTSIEFSNKYQANPITHSYFKASDLYNPKPKKISTLYITSSDIKIKLSEKEISISSELYKVKNAIIESRYLLELNDNWDDEGAKVISLNVWDNMATFLVKYSSELYSRFSKKLKCPVISPCADGTIDVLWDNGNSRILFNIKNNNSNTIHFYGDQYNESEQIKGSFLVEKTYDYIIELLSQFA